MRQGPTNHSPSKTDPALLVAESMSRAGTSIWRPVSILTPRFHLAPSMACPSLSVPGDTKTYKSPVLERGGRRGVGGGSLTQASSLIHILQTAFDQSSTWQYWAFLQLLIKRSFHRAFSPCGRTVIDRQDSFIFIKYVNTFCPRP